MSDSVTPQTAAHQTPPSLGFSRQEHWSGLPFPSPMHESESEVAQSCPTLSDPMDCSLPGSSVHGIFHARVLEWGALAFSAIQCYRYLNNCCYEVSPYIIHLNHLYSNLLDFRKNSNVRYWTQCWGRASVKGLSRVSIVFLTGLVYFEYWETGWGKKM